eukprot:COSAG01_NODE_48_length_31904_cov_21.696997_12_plen_72_part_00
MHDGLITSSRGVCTSTVRRLHKWRPRSGTRGCSFEASTMRLSHAQEARLGRPREQWWLPLSRVFTCTQAEP